MQALDIGYLKRKYWRQLSQALGHRADIINPICIVILSILSIMFVYSSQSYAGGNYWKQQIIWLFLGSLVYITISSINYKIFLEYSHILYALSIFLLLLLWTPLGERIYGSLRWLNFKIFHPQPSETAKIGTLLMIASILSRSEVKNFKESFSILARVTVVFMLPLLLIFLQPDLGSSLVFPPMVFSLLYVSKLPKRFFIGTLVVFVLLISLVGIDIVKYNTFLKENNLSAVENKGAYEKHSLLPLKDYQRNRILSFAAPDIVDPRGIGVSWNLRQSLIAIGSGGLTGKGHNNGTQAKLGYLPQSVAHNDFIFSVLAEELGFMGGSFVILLYCIMAMNCIRVASNAKDRFGMLLCVGVAVILIIHIFVNIGMTIGIMPITGLPLPFLSYGGSFVLSCCVLQGLVQSVYRFRKDFT